MEVQKLARDSRVRVAALVCVCFLLGSTGWLSWLRCIMRYADPARIDLYTMVVGYLAQAAGILAFMVTSRRVGIELLARIAAASVIAYVLLLVPATMTGGLGATLAFGWAMNVLCGITQGFYLLCLSRGVERRWRGTVFGGGYAVSTLASWLISSIGGGVLASGMPCLVVCLGLAAVSVILMANGASSDAWDGALSESPSSEPDVPSKALVMLAAVTVVLVSMVKNTGFSFPSADLSEAVNLELSRLFYGVGLVAAGIAADRDRRLALGCCAASLAVPFLMLSLTGAGVSGVVLWAIGYLLFGFFTVFRVVLFADIAACEGMAWLAGAGLMLGRVGDVLGTALCLACGDATVTLIGITSVLFVASMGLMFALYQGLHANPPDIEPSVPYERDALGEFCATYGLSAREREVLPLLLAGKTNAEIAAELFVSVNTVKYHTRNIRQKTGCETRLDVVDLYVRSGGQLAR